mgnify:FL=1
MDTRKKNKLVSTNAYPHNGEVLKQYFTKHNVNRAELARQLGVSPTTVMRYFDSQSLQLGILWKTSQVLKHNFVAELGEQLMVDYATVREIELENQLAELKKQLEKMEIELSVYKNIVGK